MKKIFPYFISYFILNSLIIPTKTNSLSELLSLLKLFNSNHMSINPFKLLLTLTKIKLESMDEDFSCTLCQRLVKAVTSSIIDKYSYEKLEYYGELLCSIVFDRELCHSYIKEYSKITVDSLILRLANEQNFCHSLGFCFEGE